MIDIVNAFMRRFYPLEIDRQDDRQWKYRCEGFHMGWEYNGPGRERRIFPEIVCADGFAMSVQAHYGAHCWPRDDFSDEPYTEFEIMAVADLTAFGARSGDRFKDGTRIYTYVPLPALLLFIGDHGGLFDWNAADLGTAR